FVASATISTPAPVLSNAGSVRTVLETLQLEHGVRRRAVARAVDTQPQPQEAPGGDRVEERAVEDGDDFSAAAGRPSEQPILLTAHLQGQLDLARSRPRPRDLPDEVLDAAPPVAGDDTRTALRGRERQPRVIALRLANDEPDLLPGPQVGAHPRHEI